MIYFLLFHDCLLSWHSHSCQQLISILNILSTFSSMKCHLTHDQIIMGDFFQSNGSHATFELILWWLYINFMRSINWIIILKQMDWLRIQRKVYFSSRIGLHEKISQQHFLSDQPNYLFFCHGKFSNFCSLTNLVGFQPITNSFGS